jgi:hypothetical protein
LDGEGLGGDHSLPLNELEYAMNASQISAPWVLSKGCAVTFSPLRAGVLRVAEGRAWVTFEMPQAARLGDAGDHFVGFGQTLAVRAGQRVVIEAWPAAGASSIRLVWEPLERSQAITNLLSRLKQRLDWRPLGLPARR